MMQNDELLTREETSKFLKRSVQSLDRDRMLGIGPEFVRVGKNAVRYKRSALYAFIELNTVKTRNRMTAA